MPPTFRFLLPALTLALAACERSATAPQGVAGPPARSVYASTNEPGTEIVGFNSCTGEVLSGTGTLHLVLSQASDAAGGQRFHAHYQYSHMQLTGDLGSSYVGKDVASSVYTINARGTVETTFVERAELIGQGRTPNELSRLVSHVTTRPDGTVAASTVDTLTIVCR